MLAAALSSAPAVVTAFQQGGISSACCSTRHHQPTSHLYSTPPSQQQPQTTAVAATTNTASATAPSISSSIISHHVAIKTRDIEMAIKFYSLLGFQIETKFVSGPARAAWLLHDSSSSVDNNNDDSTATAATVKSRIELIEVPKYMLNEPDGMKRRAVDFTKREELLGLNHYCLDVTSCINIARQQQTTIIDDTNNSGGGDNTLISNIDSVPTTKAPSPSSSSTTTTSSSCSIYNLQEYLQDLNTLSINQFGKSLRVALNPIKRIIGKSVYEMAFIYDADGTLLELLNYSGGLSQDVESGWEPWDGEGFVV
jgi:catechol 2,3-dioxygenase-like lactoylglutathione lyase family enzyme